HVQGLRGPGAPVQGAGPEAAQEPLTALELRERRREGDPWLLLLTLILVGSGLVMVLSASQALAYLQHLSPFYYLERQALGAGLLPFAILLLAALGLLALQKDLGTALVMAAIFASAYFAGGGRKRYLLLLFAGLAVLFLVMTLAEPYRAGRLAVWRNPFADPLGAGFQSSQAIPALGNGGLTGAGLRHSVENVLWLPEAHTDFIFAIVGEETGLIGTTLVLAAFVVFAVRGYRVAGRAGDRLGLMLAASITTWIAFQALVNMATVTDTLPIQGLPLPFFSYGGTSEAATVAAVGVLLNVAGQSRYESEDRRLHASTDRGRGDRWPPVPSPGRGASLPR